MHYYGVMNKDLSAHYKIIRDVILKYKVSCTRIRTSRRQHRDACLARMQQVLYGI